jgi:flagellar biosynthesis protein FlhG
MNDQATTLRQMKPATAYATSTLRPTNSHAQTIAITGGKGGVGKSNVAVNVALELVAAGRRVSLLDADLALANADVLLGLNPKAHLGHVLSGQRTLKEVVIETSHGLRLIPGGSGIEDLANLSETAHRRFIAELMAMEDESDFLIIDTPAGIARNVTSVLNAASSVVIVTTPDPTAVIDAYATLKVLHRYSPAKPVSIIVNEVVGIGDAEKVFAQLDGASKRFLQHPLEHLGTIPRDSQLAEAVRRQIPVVDYAPDTPASRSIRLIAKQFDKNFRTATRVNESSSFWKTLIAPSNSSQPTR